MGSFVCGPIVIVFKLSKKIHFLQFCPDLSKKSKSVKAISYRHPKDPVMHLQKMVIVYYAIAYCFGDIV